MAAGRPPLSYSLPAYHPQAYDNVEAHLQTLRALGFRWVTLNPTLLVHDELDLRIETTPAPDTGRAVRAARDIGMQVRLEPHLDFAGSSDWRRRMYLNPFPDYLEFVLIPMAEFAPDELTLGSELDVSLYEFPDEWELAASRVKPYGAEVGHKLNHDALGAGVADIRAALNTERARRNLPARWGLGFRKRPRAYLNALDYVAFSFYRPQPFAEAAAELREQLGRSFTIGEFGLGTASTERPWEYDRPFETPEEFAIRRRFYLDYLEWLAGEQFERAATFWSTAQFDILGLFDERWRDEELVEAVRVYNQASP